MSDEQRGQKISLLICGRLNHQSTPATSLEEIGNVYESVNIQ
jgi:hypothetical protein